MSEVRIVILDGEATNPGDLSWEGLKELGKVTVYDDTNHEDEQQIVNRIGDATIVLTNKVPITKYVLERCSSIKHINVLATGVNVIDIAEATKRKITVSNVPNYSTDSVAQLTFALLLEITNRVGHHSAEVHNGKWAENDSWTFYDYPLIELSGKTMGIIGFGSIGQAVGKIAQSVGMNVITYNRSQSESGKKIARYVEKNELFNQADVISLHIPLTEDTEEIINQESISKMKDEVILLNTARGPLLNEQDVATALNNKRMYAVGVDVAKVEPIKDTNPLLKARNCFITPHIAWATRESRERLITIATANVKHYLNDKPTHLVNNP